ncbi:MlaC/ttg2D family ABC transporter substrate-binding protein [Solemya velesiana gill symbiont]|uniref:Toluene tolerance protein n=1 Tax=Solemya velesiana gill symbiont TaxID=1918948 RepID=A0A1T2KUU6_9GAMM|nr:ABC transporter substrate-binding protein [Solemya velesiana gill symbiont]OOZ36594.1 hypothetical protein BOW51_06500 [Solemya velesiana gill symbiont]
MKIGYSVSGKFILLLFFVAVAFPVSVLAEELAEPQQVIQEISDELYVVLNLDRERVINDTDYVYRLADEILIPRVDFSKVSSLVLGKHWRRASSDQKKSFAYQFQRLLVRTYATAFREFDQWEIKHMPLRGESGAKKVSVRTKVFRPGARPVDVVYSMYRGDDGWKAYDVKIEGISLVTNYRSSFAKEMRKGGMDGLIRRIAELNDKRVKQVASAGRPRT